MSPDALAFLHEPASGPLLASVLLVAAAAAVLLIGSRVLETPRIVASGETSEIGEETPAVASLLTNGFVVTPHAAVATLLDLVARGWLRIEQVDDEVVILVDGHGALDDSLNAY